MNPDQKLKNRLPRPLHWVFRSS